MLALGSGLVVRSPQGAEYRTIVNRDEDQREKALQAQKTACQHVAGVQSLGLRNPVGDLVGAVLVKMCVVSLQCLRANQ